jgi:hypothetical protein
MIHYHLYKVIERENQRIISEHILETTQKCKKKSHNLEFYNSFRESDRNITVNEYLEV